MTHALTDYGIHTINKVGISTRYVISDMTINLTMNDLNYTTFESPVQFSSGDIVELRYQTTELIFTGKVTQCRKLARGVSTVTRYEVEVTEKAIELKSMYISDTNRVGLWINNTQKIKTLEDYVGYILAYAPGWEDVSEGSIKGQLLISDGITNIPSMGFGRCSVYNALQRLLVQLFSYGLWFEYSGSRKLLRYGEYNRDIPAGTYPTPLNITMHENSNNYNVDGVIVYGEEVDGKELMASMGSVTSGNKILVYRYSGCYSQAELNAVTGKIYAERSSPRLRFEIDFPTGYYNIHEGDNIHIYDTSIGLAQNSAGYGVKDVVITENKTVAGLGNAKMTIFDILNDRLSLIDGDVLEIGKATSTTGFGNVFANASDDSVWGTESTCIVMIGATGDTFMGDFYLYPSFGVVGTPGDNYFTIYTAAVSEFDSLVTDASAGVYQFNDDEWEDPEFEPVLTPDMFEWSWEWIEVKVQYALDEDNTEGTKAVWDFEWPGLEVIDKGGTIYGIAPFYMFEHTWFVPQSYNAPYPTSPVVITCEHAGEGTEIRIANLAITMTVYYYSSVHSSPSDSLEKGEVQMKIDDASEWITIYNPESEDGYVGAEYEMSEYIDYSTFECGSHTLRFRCKGSHPTVEYPGISVGVDYEYLSLPGNIEVIP